MALSNRHLAFIDNYMSNGRNATQAYKVVYPSANQRTAEVKGSLLANKVEVKAELEKREAELREKNQITLEFLTEKLLETYNTASEISPAAAVAALKLLAEWHGIKSKDTQDLSNQEDKTITIKIVK